MFLACGITAGILLLQVLDWFQKTPTRVVALDFLRTALRMQLQCSHAQGTPSEV